jgi:hypothetical protein
MLTVAGAVAEEAGRQTDPTGNICATFAFARTMCAGKLSFILVLIFSNIFKGNFACLGCSNKKRLLENTRNIFTCILALTYLLLFSPCNFVVC